MFHRKVQSIAFFLLFLCLFVGGNVHAADPKLSIKDSAYAAQFVAQSPNDPIEMEAGSTKVVTVTFKNTGTAAWNADGARYVSAYTVEPKGRQSLFAGDGWYSKQQTGAIDGPVAPGKTGTLTIDLVAPAVPGEYVEQLHLAAENHTWIARSYFFLKIKVVPARIVVAPAPAPAPATASSSPYRAHIFLQNVSSVTAQPGQKIDVIVAYQNTGTRPWNGYALRTVNPSVLAGVSHLSFADDVWPDPLTPLLQAKTVAPGDVTRETFSFRTPEQVGQYTADFSLSVDDTAVEGGTISIPVTVTENAPDYVNGDAIAPPAPAVSALPSEPMIRVGVWKSPPTFVQVRSEDDNYLVFDGTTQMGVLSRYDLGVLKYEDDQYSFTSPSVHFSTHAYIRLMPQTNPHATFYLWNLTRVVKWKGGSRNFNQYRGGLEYRLTQNGTMYVINELPFEDYVAGIGEASNIAPIEFLKAQAVAARTYAYFTMEHTDKHDSRNFDVVATTGDQLYLGYICETISPNYVAAVQATRGQVVTYEHNVVITPYFGHSNGKTKSWTQVWGGVTRPWLVPVVAKYDKGLRQYGHGVGMSQRDAALRAEKDKWDFVKIVTYYYTGVAIETIYE